MNPDNLTDKESKEFRRMMKVALRPENMTATLIRGLGEYLQAKGAKPNCISKKLRSALEQVPQIAGWRMKIWEYFGTTIYRNVATDPNENKFHKYGKATSQFENVVHGLEKTIAASPGIPSIAKLLKPFLTLDKEEKREAKKSLRNFNKCLKIVEREKPKLPPSQKKQIAIGETAGAQSVFDDDGLFIHKTDATMIYIMLITFGEIIDQLPSRKAMFRFLKLCLGRQMPHNEEAFIQICKRIGLKGSKGRERDRKKVKGQPVLLLSPPLLK